jgi:hypothetical protein
MSATAATNEAALPTLPLDQWKPTKETLHLWAQMVGKTRLALMPMRNHWWNATLYPSSRGLTTRRMTAEAHNLELEIDLVEHRLSARTTDSEAGFELRDGLSVADFHRRLTSALRDVHVHAHIRAEPYGVATTTPFSEDHEHASYDIDAVSRFLRVLQWSADALEEFAGWYCGKASPVQLFWHSFDLATSRFSGARAPGRPTDPVEAEAYSHEVISFGFWAGDQNYPYPAYYSYTSPEPPGLADTPLRPDAAEWAPQENGSLAILRYDDVRAADDPRSTLMAFLQSAYEAGASLAGWDLVDTATQWCPVPPERGGTSGDRR